MMFVRPSRNSSPSGPEQSKSSKRTPHVAVTGFRGIPATWGGIERQCEETYARLASRGYQITVYARSHYVPGGVRFHRGVEVKRLWTLNTKYTEAIFHTFLSILHILLIRPDIVHLYSQGPCLLIPLLRLFMPRVKVFFTCVGLDWRRKKWPSWASRIIRLGEFFSARLPHFHIVVSRDLQDYYRDHYGVNPYYIPNGVVSAEQIPFREALRFQLQPKAYFLFVGRLVPEKRVEDLIEAFLSRPRRNRLVIVGDSAGTGDYVERLKAIAGDASSVVFAGYQYGRSLGELYSNSRAFITPSELEGMPLTLLEALSHGLVCVASEIPPHREILQGIMHLSFPVGCVDALSRCLDELDGMEPAQLDDHGRKARRHVADRFSWDLVADRLEDLYILSVRKIS